MLKNYFKIAWRNIIKNRFYSSVNIIGLSTGIAFTLLIGAYVWSELEVNTNLKNADRQYILQSKWKDPNEGFYMATLGPLGKALKENYPNLVANYYRYDGVSSNISKGEKSFRENLQIGDSTMLNMYGFPLLYGDPSTALRQPFTTVITATKALKYFGKTDVVGQTVTIESFSGTKHDFIIKGVLKELQNNSVTRLIDNYPGDFYVSTDNLDFFGRNMTWQNSFIVNLIELKKGVTPKDLEKPIAHLIKQNGPPFTVDLTPQLVSLKDFYLDANNGLIKKNALRFVCHCVVHSCNGNYQLYKYVCEPLCCKNERNRHSKSIGRIEETIDYAVSHRINYHCFYCNNVCFYYLCVCTKFI